MKSNYGYINYDSDLYKEAKGHMSVTNDISEWECEMWEGFVFAPTSKQKIPNAFHRFMLRIFFGFDWRKR